MFLSVFFVMSGGRFAMCVEWHEFTERFNAKLGGIFTLLTTNWDDFDLKKYLLSTLVVRTHNQWSLFLQIKTQ